MNSVERVKAICKEKRIPIYKLEKDLGYANGYISQLKKGTFPADRLHEIADYIGLLLHIAVKPTFFRGSLPVCHLTVT